MTSGLWYKAALHDDRIVDEQISILREQFAVALEAVGWPDGACLFLITRHNDSGTVREDEGAGEAEALFFSPAAISVVPHLIAVCGAEPSPPPDRACATLLVGKPTDWDLLPRSTH
jgi:hypothetical protein